MMTKMQTSKPHQYNTHNETVNKQTNKQKPLTCNSSSNSSRNTAITITTTNHMGSSRMSNAQDGAAYVDQK